MHRTLVSLARRARAFRDTSLPSSCSSTALTTPAPHVARLNNAARFAPDVFAPSFPLTSLCTALAPGRGAPSRVAAIWRETLKPKQITPTPLPPPARRSTCCLRIRLATTTSKSQARSSHHTPRATRLPQGQGTSTSRPKYLEGSSCYHAPNQRVKRSELARRASPHTRDTLSRITSRTPRDMPSPSAHTPVGGHNTRSCKSSGLGT